MWSRKVQTETKQGSPHCPIFTAGCMFLGYNKQTNLFKTRCMLAPYPRKSDIPCILGWNLYAGVLRTIITRSALKIFDSPQKSIWISAEPGVKGLHVNFKAGLGLTGIVFFQITPLKNVSSRFAVIRAQKEPWKLRCRLCPKKVNPLNLAIWYVTWAAGKYYSIFLCSLLAKTRNLCVDV